jgi:hypothetical protein
VSDAPVIPPPTTNAAGLGRNRRAARVATASAAQPQTASTGQQIEPPKETPAERPVSAPATATVAGGPGQDPNAHRGSSGASPSAGSVAPRSRTETAPVVPTTSSPAQTSPIGDDQAEGGFDETEWHGGKITRQAYVPVSIATKVKALQQTGISSEAIVLNAVAACEEQLPGLIHQARGPVHQGGLFPGLQIISKGPGGPKKVEQPIVRLQYQLSEQWWPPLKALAKRYNLKLSVLVRLALGAYFDVPVRIARTM